jgi:hypothetical protein
MQFGRPFAGDVRYPRYTRRIRMKANVGMIDRGIRIVVGLALVVLAVMNVIGPWGYIGVVPILTGVFRFCPAYPLLGINTCGTSKS